MTPKWSPILVGLCTLMVSFAHAQETQLPKGERTVGGFARKISEILGGATVAEEEDLELDDLAVAVELALMDIDPDHISRLNREMGRLRHQEEELSSRINDLDKGLTIDVDNVGAPITPSEDISEEALEIERNQLKARQLKIKELEIRRAKRQAEVNAINDAKTMTPLSAALLSTLESIPKLQPMATTANPTRSEFPARMAHALFRTRDFVGALKQFKMLKEEELTPQDRYEMARSLEETNDKEAALVAAKKLVEVTLAVDDFWHARGENLVKLLKTMLGIPIESPEGKDA